MNPELMNESEDLKSTRDISGVSGIDLEVTGIMRASGVVMEVLRVTIVCARTYEMLTLINAIESWAISDFDPSSLNRHGQQQSASDAIVSTGVYVLLRQGKRSFTSAQV